MYFLQVDVCEALALISRWEHALHIQNPVTNQGRPLRRTTKRTQQAPTKIYQTSLARKSIRIAHIDPFLQTKGFPSPEDYQLGWLYFFPLIPDYRPRRSTLAYEILSSTAGPFLSSFYIPCKTKAFTRIFSWLSIVGWVFYNFPIFFVLKAFFFSSHELRGFILYIHTHRNSYRELSICINQKHVATCYACR